MSRYSPALFAGLRFVPPGGNWVTAIKLPMYTYFDPAIPGVEMCSAYTNEKQCKEKVRTCT